MKHIEQINQQTLKWLALQYKNTWCIPTNAQEVSGCLEVSGLNNNINSQYVTIDVKSTESYGSRYLGALLNNEMVKNIKVYEITYPGKYVMVYNNIAMTTGGLLGTTYQIKIPKSSFATVTPNEAYLKITMTANNGVIINLNNANNDKSARINIPIQVIGSTQWRGTKQYFDSIGIISFDTFGSEGQSPESQYFTSAYGR